MTASRPRAPEADGDGLSVRVPAALERFVREEVAAGRHADAEAVVAAALERLRDDDEAAWWRARYARELIQTGLDQLDRGEGIEVADVKAWMDELEAEVEAEFK